MGCIDIVVFPNGGREIFGQISEAPMEACLTTVQAFLETLAASDKPRKYTGYYDASDVSDIEWQDYDENNPIVMVPIPLEEIEPTGDPTIDQYPVEQAYRPMELAHVPAEMRDRLDIQGY